MRAEHINLLKINKHNLWMQSHCAAPLPYKISDDKMRIYFSSRDCHNKLRVASVIYSLSQNNVSHISAEPILDIGQEGFFDSNAIYPAEILKFDKKIFLYYTGRSAGINRTYYASLGLAISNDNGKSFKKYSNAPIMERSHYDPWMIGPCAIVKYNNIFVMLYTSGYMFDSSKNTSSYDIKYATSDDGINWKRNGLVCIPLAKDVSNIAAPSIIQLNGIFHMWFCYYQSSRYKVGYAKSRNLRNWKICYNYQYFDGIEAAYPKAIVVKDNVFIFYSSGKYGADGINLCKISSDNLL